MYQQQYYVPKDSGTLSDTLIAFGFARVVADLIRQQGYEPNVLIQDAGSCYVIDAGMPIQKGWLQNAQPMEHIAYLAGNRVTIPDGLAGIHLRDVDIEWERFRQYQEQRKQLRDDKVVGDELQNLLADTKPRPDWTVTTYLADYRMQAQSIYNDLVAQWHLSARQFIALNLRTILALFASLAVDQEAITKEWKVSTKAAAFKDTVTASQLFNPHMGKGQNRAKANNLSMGNEKSFWLVEYLKAVGLWEAGAPRNVQNADMRKTYVLVPRQIALSNHRAIFNRFRDRLWNDSAVKLDVLAALLYVDVLLEYSSESGDIAIFNDGTVSDLVAGMQVATYQLLSRNAYTMMNLSFLGLPDWMPHIRTFEDVQAFRELIQEHIERVRTIDEERSEGYALLQRYRDFVSGADLNAFFDFSAGYGSYLISELERSHFYVRPFTETNLRRLFEMTKPELLPIVQSPGFRNIAEAIRRSTVVPQYIGRKKSRFEVRYGLGQDLKRKAQYPDDFIQELADFMQSYNEENARVYERTKGVSRRKAITTQDIEEIIRLIDQYDSKTVCNLLIAFGYARDPKVEVDETMIKSEEEVAVEEAGIA